MVRHSGFVAAVLAVGALGAGCAGGAAISPSNERNAVTAGPLTVPGGSSADGGSATDGGSAAGGASPGGSANAVVFRGDSSQMPSWGGWAWGNVPADAVAHAGFDWFETGYPGPDMVAVNATLTASKVRPFAYINLGELESSLAPQAKYTGQILATNSDWGTQLIDVTDPSWQDWILKRADEAYGQGSRGVKWDVATPNVPPGKTRQDVNDAIASIMAAIRQQHPDMKFVFNQGADFALAYPQFVNGVEAEGLFSTASYPAAYLQPWNDPYYWGPQYQQMKSVHDKGIPIFDAEYVDPSSQNARDLYAAITAQGFVPYITNDHWNIRGWGYNVNPGW